MVDLLYRPDDAVAVALLLAMDRAALLTEAERAALDRRASSQGMLA
jgi:hypothetical protein